MLLDLLNIGLIFEYLRSKYSLQIFKMETPITLEFRTEFKKRGLMILSP